MTTEEKIALLEDLMELDGGTLDINAQLEDVEEWDSFAKLALMEEIRKRNKKTITVAELRLFQTVKDICNYLG